MPITYRYYLRRGRRIIVLAPTQELVNSLHRDMFKLHGGGIVGISAGDRKVVDGKYVIVATPESYISAVRSNKEWVDAGLLVVDEAHNLFEKDRGGDIDVAITLFTKRGGKVMLMSGTFPNSKEVAARLDADLFVCKYRKTIIHTKHIDCPDDFGAVKKSNKDFRNKGMVPTASGDFAYSGFSSRLGLLKGILSDHEGESILIFVPTKTIGFCLADHLKVGFHCADVDRDVKDELIANFRDGTRTVMIATTTLSQGVNTPADVVIIFGTRSWNNFEDQMSVNQKKGRAGRGKDKATVYLLADKIEYFHATKEILISSLPLPCESMTLTVLSQGPATKPDLTDALASTYSATFHTRQKIEGTVDRYLHYLEECKECDILAYDNGKYSLTPEGTLLSRYYIKPSDYMAYINMANKLMKIPEPVPGQKTPAALPGDSASCAPEVPAIPTIAPLSKGTILLSLVLPGDSFYNCPERYKKDVLMRLRDHKLDSEVSIEKIGTLRSYMEKASLMPQFFPWQLPAVERWLSMFEDMTKYRVHIQTPGSNWLQLASVALKKNADIVMARARAKARAMAQQDKAKAKAKSGVDTKPKSHVKPKTLKAKTPDQLDLIGVSEAPITVQSGSEAVTSAPPISPKVSDVAANEAGAALNQEQKQQDTHPNVVPLRPALPVTEGKTADEPPPYTVEELSMLAEMEELEQALESRLDYVKPEEPAA